MHHLNAYLKISNSHLRTKAESKALQSPAQFPPTAEEMTNEQGVALVATIHQVALPHCWLWTLHGIGSTTLHSIAAGREVFEETTDECPIHRPDEEPRQVEMQICLLLLN